MAPPRSPLRFNGRAWLLIPLFAAGFLIWASLERARRVEFVTNTDREEAVVDATSATGYAGGQRWLIVPEHNNRSYQWIAETQQMLAQKEWRVRHIDTENAPIGRAVHSASPYRWWLGLVAWCDHRLSGRPLGISVEQAALWADPLMQLLLLAGSTAFVARQFGVFPAALLAFGLATLFPFAGGFLPGVPDDHGLSCIVALWSVLPLLAAAAASRGSPAKPGGADVPANEMIHRERRAHRLFALAGVAGGLGLWINVSSQIPVIVGIALGGILAAWISLKNPKAPVADPPTPTPWRTWALAGAATSLAAYLTEYFPSQLDFRLQVNSPLYALLWIGVGELLVQCELWFRRGKSYWIPRQILPLGFAILAIGALPFALKLSDAPGNIFSGDPSASRLTNLPNGTVAKTTAAWFARDGLTAAGLATCVPLLLLIPAITLLARSRTALASRAALALGLGPVFLALLFATSQLAWWNLFDVVLFGLLVAVAAALTPGDSQPWRRWLLVGLTGLAFIPGLIQLLPQRVTDGNHEFTKLEVESLVERTLAHWIADHAGPGGAVVLLPPDRTPSWCFHGGLRGIGTANWENRDGLTAVIRMVSATTSEQAQALLSQRGVTHIILPSWDSDLDEFVRWSMPHPDDSFLAALHRWALPPWLRPLPYPLPVIAGFEDQSVAIIEVNEENNPATALSRVAEYFLESQKIEMAKVAGRALRGYPADLGALVTLAQIERAAGDLPAATKVFHELLANLAGGNDRSLAWDRRVSLAIVLAQNERNDLARDQLKRCVEKLNSTRIRSLTTMTLFRLQLLSKNYNLPIADPTARALALKLLPAELRSRLQ